MEYYGTIGPACADEDVLRRMFRAGMTGVRMNLSHGGLAEHRDWLERIARAAEGRPCRLLIDLQGPEVRIGRLPAPLVLKNRQAVTLGQGGIPIPEALTGLAKPGQTLLLDDGKLELTVTGGRPGALFCTVVRGGTLESRKSLAAPGLDLHLPTLTDEDEENLALAKGCGVTGVMLPFVRGREDLEHLRAALHRAGADGVRILAKIESREGAEHLESLFGAADEIVIARGDLGNAMDLWQLPGVQRRMAAACRRAGVPFMVVTQMLDSMRENPVPTRAEVCDVYTSVMQGAASVMLTGETAAGKWPAEAINYLVKTGEEARRDRAAGEG